MTTTEPTNTFRRSNLPSAINPALMRSILLKIAYKPELMKRTEAAVLYVALSGETFTADVIPGELREDNTTPGAVISTLARLGLIENRGRCTSPAESRNGSEVRKWRMALGKRSAIEAWLKVNGFPPVDMGDGDLFGAITQATKTDKKEGWEYGE
jgi:hypothetical protein